MFTLRVNSFAASLPRFEGYMVLFLFFSFAVSSTMATPFLDHVVRDREHPVLVYEICGWIRFQPRSVRSCSGSLLDSSGEDIENIALSELFRTTRITLHCPCHESSLSKCHWLVCRLYFAASRPEVLLDEDDSRSSSRARESGSSLLVSQLQVAIQTP